MIPVRVDNSLIGPLGNLTWIKDRTIRLHMTRRQRGFLQFFDQVGQGWTRFGSSRFRSRWGRLCRGWTNRRLTASLFS